MSCSKAQLILLLRKIASEMRCREDRETVLQYAGKIEKQAWVEIVRELL